MTVEMAAYYRAMLLVGIRDRFDADFDQSLEMDTPLSDLELSLSTCISNDDAVLSVLQEYILGRAVNEQIVCNLVLEDFRCRYRAGKLTRREVTECVCCMVERMDKRWDDPWESLTTPEHALDLLQDGLIAEEVFNQCFDAWLFEGKHINPWELQQKRNKQNGHTKKTGFLRKIRSFFGNRQGQ
ncbi:MAG: hypothetical protein E7438_03605 [Ruminococcaceae bacterium]|nr:hypothetical protein [Oscillospiraceae bacterium]